MKDPEGNTKRRRVIAGLVAALAQLAGCGGSGSGPSNGGGSAQPPSPRPPPPPPPPPIAVFVTPAAASLRSGVTQNFTATVTNTSNKAVIWQVNELVGGTLSIGTISTAGVYTAPATVPSPAMVTITAVSEADPTRSGSAAVSIIAPQPATSWLWGITTDDPTVQLASQLSSVAAFPRRVTIRTVFDPPMGGSPAASDYLQSVRALSDKGDVMGLPVDSSAMSQLTTVAIGARIAEYLSTLGPYVRIWEIGNEVNGNWLGQDVITKIETMYDAAKAAGKLTALTLYYENPPTPGYEMISWVDRNIPPGHRMRSGLDFVLVSYYEDQNAGHRLSQSELDTMFAAIATRFTSASLGFGECGWGDQIPSDEATRAALIRRFYGYRVPSVPAYSGGCFYWHFRQTMVPSGTSDWTVLQSLMLAA